MEDEVGWWEDQPLAIILTLTLGASAEAVTMVAEKGQIREPFQRQNQ